MPDAKDEAVNALDEPDATTWPPNAVEPTEYIVPLVGEVGADEVVVLITR